MTERFSKELLRKSVHASGIFFVPLLLWNRTYFTLLVLISLVIYLAVELASRRGYTIFFLTQFSEKCKRKPEEKKLSKGALFLIAASLVLPYLFGSFAAAVGLSQIYLGDAASTLVGASCGKKKLPYSPNKSWMGSAAYWIIASLVGSYFIPWPSAMLLGGIGAIIESLPLSEWDNLLVPLAIAGLVKFKNYY